MNYILVTPQARGQITLPVKLRRKYDIKPGVQVRVSDQGQGIVIEPLGDALTVKPRYTHEEIKTRLKVYETSGKVFWTKEDDVELAKLREKDDQYINW